MARKLNPEGIIDTQTYLFENHAQYKDSVYKVFEDLAKRHNIPVTITRETMKSGGLLLGSKDEMLVVEGGHKPFVVIGVTTYGKFLSVNYYLLVEDSFLNKLGARFAGTALQNLGYFGKDLISVRDMQSFSSCVKAVLEETFNELQFVEFNSGFLGTK